MRDHRKVAWERLHMVALMEDDDCIREVLDVLGLLLRASQCCLT
jgi:hypothetical protein